jgi:6-phosphogluconolactonase
MAQKSTGIQIFPTGEEVAQAAALEFTHLANDALRQREFFAVALAGGSTPKRLYQILAGQAQDWSSVHFFFGDERHVPPDHPDSNFRMVNENLFSKIKLPAGNIHRVPAENPDATAAATQYEQELKSFFTTHHRMADGFPVFDLILLGMGPDGHTASLFPGSEGLKEQSRWVIANHVEKFETDRITLTFPAINHAQEILFLVTGEDKAAMIGEVLEKKATEKIYPVQRVEPVNGSKLWILDKAAAKELKLTA